jgi:hypothetical protein
MWQTRDFSCHRAGWLPLGHSTAGIHLNGLFGLSQVQVVIWVLDSNSTGLRVATSLPLLNVLEVTGGSAIIALGRLPRPCHVINVMVFFPKGKEYCSNLVD